MLIKEIKQKGFIDTNFHGPIFNISVYKKDEIPDFAPELPSQVEKIKFKSSNNSCEIACPEGYIDPLDFAKSLRKIADWLEKHQNQYMVMDD